jgi:hypothetical protein
MRLATALAAWASIPGNDVAVDVHGDGDVGVGRLESGSTDPRGSVRISISTPGAFADAMLKAGRS